MDRLKEAIIGEIHRQRVRVTLTIPYQKGGLLSRIRANGTVLSEEYAEAGTVVTAILPQEYASRVQAELDG